MNNELCLLSHSCPSKHKIASIALTLLLTLDTSYVKWTFIYKMSKLSLFYLEQQMNRVIVIMLRWVISRLFSENCTLKNLTLNHPFTWKRHLCLCFSDCPPLWRHSDPGGQRQRPVSDQQTDGACQQVRLTTHLTQSIHSVLLHTMWRPKCGS